jgi:Mrp family chromosome partitioning ATPase
MQKSVQRVADVQIPHEVPALSRIASLLILRERPQAVAFIAARLGEGTSTTAREFVRLLSQLGYKVLLVNSALPDSTERRNTTSYSIDMMSSGQQLQMMVHRADNAPYHELWLGSRSTPGLAARVAVNDEFWRDLKGIYDYLVIDSPPLEQTYDGVVLASRADGVVILVEAESTPGWAVTSLRATLEEMGAKILGVVMTKQREYLPKRLRWGG